VYSASAMCPEVYWYVTPSTACQSTSVGICRLPSCADRSSIIISAVGAV
jgi:hypothetical protein